MAGGYEFLFFVSIALLVLPDDNFYPIAMYQSCADKTRIKFSTAPASRKNNLENLGNPKSAEWVGIKIDTLATPCSSTPKL